VRASRHHLERDHHRRGGSFGDQFALPGGNRRRRRDHLQLQPLPGHDHRDAAADEHDLCHRLHDERPHTTQAGCLAATPSDVIWNFSTATSGSSHTLTTPLTVGASGQANNPLAVTLTNDASMTAASPAACANTYFSLPSLTGITATGGAATSTTTPATDAWTS